MVSADFDENSPTRDRGTISSIFDVALSYAGEDRYYVKQVAEILRDSGIHVFYLVITALGSCVELFIRTVIVDGEFNVIFLYSFVNRFK